jgi:hypothetical protein
VLLAVALHVEGGDVQQVGVVAEQAQPVVAPLAQQPADPAGGMVVIKVLRLPIAADGADIALIPTKLIDRVAGDSVLAEPVRVLAQAVMARLAAPTEAGRRGGVADVVLVRNGPFAGGTPPETIRHPGQVADVFAE